MRCSKCGHDNRSGAKFCEECAARLARTCGNCGTQLSVTAKFCPECAHPTGAEVRQPPVVTPQTYTPKHLAEKILTSKSALEGERKQVTVLFADLKGSMELLADRDPEEARKILDPVIERMMEAVHRYEGTVNQVMGDGIMALFGAPIAHEDHAARACYAALRVQDSVKEYAEEVRRSDGAVVQVRVGLNSGEVVVRAIGSDLHMDYTAVGQTTHLAARMEQAAIPGSILVAPDTLRLAEGFVQTKSLGGINVKGLGAPVEVFELLGASEIRSRLEVAAARGLTRFVGRDAEMEQLRRALDLANAGHGQVVAVVGEPGVGKSRLFWECTHSASTKGWLILRSSSVSHGKATPYLPVTELLRTYFQVEVRDDARAVRQRVTDKLAALDEALIAAVPALLTLLDVSFEAREWEALDPRERRQRTLNALKRLVLRESAIQPVMLVFEDLQWIDSETQAFLDGLVSSLPTSRLVLLVNYRPEYHHAWGGKGYYTQLRIDPLRPEGADALLHGLLGDDGALIPVKRLLTEQTGGNPFFLEESVRSLVETEFLTGKHGHYRLARPLAAIQVPATVQALLAARMDRLQSEEKALLQTASVIGKDIAFPLLQAIAELPDGELRLALASLQEGEFLYESKLFPELEYTFKHALTHDVAYQSLLLDHRRLLHGRIAEKIELLFGEQLPEWIDRLAHHAVRAAAWEKAFGYLQQAAAKAMTRSAYREAAEYFEQALDAARRLPQERSLLEREIDLRFDLRWALTQSGRFRQALDQLSAAYVLAQGLNDQLRLARVSIFMATSFSNIGEHARAIECGLQALGIAMTLDDFSLKVGANFFLGEAYTRVADYPRAIQHLAWNVEHIRDNRLQERFGLAGLPSVQSRGFLALILADQGEFARGRALAVESLRIAEAGERPVSLVQACNRLGRLYIEEGQAEAAIRILERGVNVAERSGLDSWRSDTICLSGYAYALVGRRDKAISLLAEGLADYVATRGGQPLFAGWLGEVYLQAGQADEARKFATDALELARRRGERGYEARVLHILGDIAGLADPPNLSVATARQGEAITLAQELGMRPLIAHCHHSLGKLYQRIKARHAQEHFTTAVKMYREMGMQFWLEQAETEMRQLGGA